MVNKYHDVIVNAIVVGVGKLARGEGVDALDEVSRHLDEIAARRCVFGKHNVTARN